MIASYDLGKNFTKFFAGHGQKIFHLYYDRAANQYSKSGKDFASQLKEAIEKQDGIYTGWHVKLMSRNQGDITHAQEFDLMIQMMGERHPKLPKLLIDQYQCRELKSSLENAPVIVKQRGDKRTIQKDKSSERDLPLERLPLESTNFSDAFKYLICRPEWLAIAFKAAKLPNDSIVFQLGEQEVNDHITQAKTLTEKITTLGSSVCISRFGCNVNPFNALHHVPAKYIKIDGTFTQELQNGTPERFNTLVNELHTIEKITIVPFVENASVLSKLWQSGVHYIQGYYLQAPTASMDYEFDSE